MINAERLVAAPREVVWEALFVDHPTSPSDCRHIAEAPERGVGACHVLVGPPGEPWGFRKVMYTEVTAYEEGHSYTAQMSAVTADHLETVRLLESPTGGTVVTISGVWSRPVLPGTDPSSLQARLDKAAQRMLAQIAERAEGTPPAPAPDPAG